jgi:iron complex outermembrane receptor protein
MEFTIFTNPTLQSIVLNPTTSLSRLTLFRKLCFVAMLVNCVEAIAQQSEEIAANLKKLSIEELMNVEVEVTSVSGHPEKYTEVASAIQVITNEDIRRSAATSLPEVLRLMPNLQVSQYNSYAWIIGARGFNAIFANKLLVMIDGRTVYSPLFAGVFWDAQSVLLEDVERIEVISGPGGTLWGANAVNGVINIITKSAAKTKGLYATVTRGTYLKNSGTARYGDNIGAHLSYRIFVQGHERSNTFVPGNTDNTDKWNFLQSGFRVDWQPPGKNKISWQGNVYGGTERTAPQHSAFDGQNVLGRWNHTFSERAEVTLQLYFDRTWRRDIPSTFSDELTTYDFDFQNRIGIGRRHNILWGAGYRKMHNLTQNSTLFVGFVPKDRDLELFGGFLQDEFLLIPEVFKITLGAKVQHNNFTGAEVQPSARVTYMPGKDHTLWAALSRAVRTPSRIDVDYHIPVFPVAPSVQNVAGGPNFQSEKVVAYELGYRMQPLSSLFISLALFHNRYDDLYSVEVLPGTRTYQIQNGTQGHSEGIEFSGTFQPLKTWRIRGGYTYFKKKLENKPGRIYNFSALGNDANNRFLVQSILDLPWNFQTDVTVRYVESLPEPYIPAYFAFDIRLAWVYKILELSLTGQNLFKGRHKEFGMEIPQNIYGRIACRI